MPALVVVCVCVSACSSFSVSGCPGRVGLVPAASVVWVGLGASGWSLSGVGVVVSPLPVSRQVQIEGSCTVKGANLRTGQVMSGIHWQSDEGFSARRPDASAVVCSYVFAEPSCGVEAWHAGDCDPGF